MNFVKGMAIGIAVGAVAGVVLDPISDRRRNKMQKNTSNFFANMGSMLDKMTR